MLTRETARAKVEEGISSPVDVYVGQNEDRASQLGTLATDLRNNLCDPFLVEAQVMPPGFPFASVGQLLKGYCVAHRKGYWLVYQPAEDRFLCFWGQSTAHLGAHGVFGSPLYCWSA